LLRYTRKARAFLLGFDDADGGAVHHQQVVALAGLKRHFAQGDAAGSGGVEVAVILYRPASGRQQSVNLFSPLLFLVLAPTVSPDTGTLGYFSLNTGDQAASSSPIKLPGSLPVGVSMPFLMDWGMPGMESR